jgi:branched-chain amino acid transport system ATP-binding protein
MHMTGAVPLEIKGLTAGYGIASVIEDITFAIEPAQTLAVLGRNGVGKSTLLASIMGLTRRHAGQVLLGHEDLSLLATPDRALRGLGYVPQTRDIFKSLDVEENLRTGLKARGRDALGESYHLFPRLYERRRTPAGQLSGGEQQMLSVARTLLGQPRVLLLDEPLEGLAPVICDELMSSLHALAAQGGMTMLLVEQQIERALDFAVFVIILDRGRIAWQGTPSALRSDPAIIEKHIGVGIH